MRSYVLIGKLVDKNNVIIGYRLRDKGNNIVNVSRSKALKLSDIIINAKVKGSYLVLTDCHTAQLSKYTVKQTEHKVKPTTLVKFRDFTNAKINPFTPDGVGKKVLVDTPDGSYLLKFGKRNSIDGTLTKDYISEFISCRIAKTLGYSVQQSELAYFTGQECVALEYLGDNLVTLKGLGYSTVEGEVLCSRDIRYSLDWLLGLRMTDKFTLSQKQYTKWVWDVFFLDALVGNYDRHEGNWGFLKLKNGQKTLAPLYDMGASLFIREMDEAIFWDNGRLKSELETHIRSAVLFKGKKRNYFQILQYYIQRNEVARNHFEQFLALVEKNIDSFSNIYSVVMQYSSSYTDYVRFVDRMLRMKLKLMRNLL